MPTDQYHEPPNELSDEVRTFARLCTSLTEEAEAIGWDQQRLALATNLGRIAAIDAPFAGVSAVQRRVLPLVELRAPFSVSRAELADCERGAEDTDFAELDKAAHSLAVAENASVFHGFAAAGIAGI